jgi:hypothetical protein
MTHEDLSGTAANQLLPTVVTDSNALRMITQYASLEDCPVVVLKARHAELGFAFISLTERIAWATGTNPRLTVGLEQCFKEPGRDTFDGNRYRVYSGEDQVAALEVETHANGQRTADFGPEDWAAEIRQREADCTTIAGLLQQPES